MKIKFPQHLVAIELAHTGRTHIQRRAAAGLPNAARLPDPRTHLEYRGNQIRKAQEILAQHGEVKLIVKDGIPQV